MQRCLINLRPPPLRRKVTPIIVAQFSEEFIIVLEIVILTQHRLISGYIAQKHPIVRVNQYIFWLDIAMDHFYWVTLLHGAHELEDKPYFFVVW